MPIYEYQCPKCSHRFEMIHGVSEKDKQKPCPKCGDPKPQRVMSTFACGGAKGTEVGSASGGCGTGGGRFT